jgi:hypothetical protein
MAGILPGKAPKRHGFLSLRRADGHAVRGSERLVR